MADFSATINSLRSLIGEHARDVDPKKHIHVAWVCITEDLRRVEPAEEQLVKMLADYMPVIVVITKARADREFSKTVQQLLPLARNVIRIRAIQEELDEGYILPPLGLKDLVDYNNAVSTRRAKASLYCCSKSRHWPKKKPISQDCGSSSS